MAREFSTIGIQFAHLHVWLIPIMTSMSLNIRYWEIGHIIWMMHTCMRLFSRAPKGFTRLLILPSVCVCVFVCVCACVSRENNWFLWNFAWKFHYFMPSACDKQIEHRSKAKVKVTKIMKTHFLSHNFWTGSRRYFWLVSTCSWSKYLITKYPSPHDVRRTVFGSRGVK